MLTIQVSPQFLGALLISACILIPSTVSADGANLSDCMVGCKPGDALCTDYCVRQFPGQSQTPCDEEFAECNEKCESLAGLKALMCYKQCQSELRGCLGQSANPDAEFNAPGWISPQECGRCQTWSPTLQKCVGAPRELCEPN